jgi:hypothetical protein
MYSSHGNLSSLENQTIPFNTFLLRYLISFTMDSALTLCSSLFPVMVPAAPGLGGDDDDEGPGGRLAGGGGGSRLVEGGEGGGGG